MYISLDFNIDLGRCNLSSLFKYCYNLPHHLFTQWKINSIMDSTGLIRYLNMVSYFPLLSIMDNWLLSWPTVSILPYNRNWSISWIDFHCKHKRTNEIVWLLVFWLRIGERLVAYKYVSIDKIVSWSKELLIHIIKPSLC